MSLKQNRGERTIKTRDKYSFIHDAHGGDLCEQMHCAIFQPVICAHRSPVTFFRQVTFDIFPLGDLSDLSDLDHDLSHA